MPEWPDWMKAAVPAAKDLPTPELFGQLIQGAVLGAVVAAVYYWTQRKRRAEAASFVTTLILLTVLIGMVTRVIGDNVARAFSLAGAISIIRFRTVVDDSRDIAFVIAAVVTGMAVGAGMPGVALAGLLVVAVVATGLMFWSGGYTARPRTGKLVVRVAIGPDPNGVVASTMDKFLADIGLVSAGTARQGAVVELTYAAALKPGATAAGLVVELNRLPEVQGAEWTGTTRAE